MKAKSRVVNVVQTLFMVLLAVIVLLPIYIAAANTFKQSDLILDQPLTLPIPPILDNIVAVLRSPNTDLFEMYRNSLVLMAAGTVITVLVSSMASYYLARVTSRMSRMLRLYFLAGIMVPYVIVYLPLCILMRYTEIPFGVPILIFVFVSGNISFSTFMYTNYIRSLPLELEEAAAH